MSTSQIPVAKPYASAAVWKSFIQSPSIVLLQNLIYQIQEIHPHEPARKIPDMSVFKDCIRPDLRTKATILLGVEFESSTDLHDTAPRMSAFITMTVLQLSVLSQSAGLPADAGEREAAVEMLLEVFTPENINGDVFGDSNNVMHLAAFLQLNITLEMLVAHGGNPLIENGRGLTAYDVFRAVKDDQFDIDSFLCNKTTRTQGEPQDNIMESSQAKGVRKAAGAEEIDITAQLHHHLSPKTHYSLREDDKNYSQHYVSDGTELEMSDGPQVFQLTFDDDAEEEAQPRTMAQRRCYSPQKLDDLTECNAEEDESEDSIRLVEQDAFELDQRRQLFYQQQTFPFYTGSDVESDLDSDDGLHQDTECYFKALCHQPESNTQTQLYSILKNSPGWPPQTRNLNQKRTYEVYQNYIATLHLQPNSESISQSTSQAQGTAAEVKKCVRWRPVKKVRIFRRYLNYSSDEDSEAEEPPVSDPFEAPVEDHFDNALNSPYQAIRPMTSGGSDSPPLYKDKDKGVNAAGEGSLPLMNYTRPLPEIPRQKERFKFSFSTRKSISRSTTPPPLALGDCTLSNLVKPKRTSGLWSPRSSSSPYSMPNFSISESRLASVARMTFKHDTSKEDEESPHRPLSPVRSGSALGILESPQWLLNTFARPGSPSNSLSRAICRTDKASSKLADGIRDRMAPLDGDNQLSLSDSETEGTKDDKAPGLKRPSLAISAFLSPVYDATFKLSKKSSEVDDGADDSRTESGVLMNLKSSLRGKFNTPPFRVLTPLLHTHPSNTSHSAPTSPALNATLNSFTFPGAGSALRQLCSKVDDKNPSSNEGGFQEEQRGREQRRLNQTVLTAGGGTGAALRAGLHLPRVTSPLSNFSFTRADTQSPELYSNEEDIQSLDWTSKRSSSESPLRITNLPGHQPKSDSGVSLDTSAFVKELFDQRLPLLPDQMRPIGDADTVVDENRHHGAAALARPPYEKLDQVDTTVLDGPQKPGEDGGLATYRASKSSLSSTRHSQWKKRKEVMVLIPPKRTIITSSTISLEGLLQTNSNLGLDSTTEEPLEAPMDMAADSGLVERFALDAHEPESDNSETVYPRPQCDAVDPSKETFGGIHVVDLAISPGVTKESHDSKDSLECMDASSSALAKSSMVKSYSLWKDASDMLSRSRRTTLSSCDSPSTTHTGVLYLRLRSACSFSLPIPSERTMISLRIDTGHEKVDTDYVPLQYIEILFNQEFCLPVTPSLAITITLHLMQAPHLQPRYLAPRQQPRMHFHQKNNPPCGPFSTEDSLPLVCTPVPRSKDPMSPKSSIFSSVRTKKSLVLPSLFKKRSQLSTNTDSSCSPTVSTPSSDTASTSASIHAREPEEPAMTSSSSVSSSSRESCSRSISTTSADTLSNSRMDRFFQTSIASSPLSDSGKNEKQKAMSTFSKWKSGIMSVHKRRKDIDMNLRHNQFEQQQEKEMKQEKQSQYLGITMDDVENFQPYQQVYHPQDQEQQFLPRNIDPQFVTGTTNNDSNTPHDNDDDPVLAPTLSPLLPSLTLSMSSSPLPIVPKLPQLTLSGIRETETPLQVLARHILFEDELCIARSGIMFRELRNACENQIVNVEFQTINNWVDLNDYSQVSGSAGIPGRDLFTAKNSVSKKRQAYAKNEEQDDHQEDQKNDGCDQHYDDDDDNYDKEEGEKEDDDNEDDSKEGEPVAAESIVARLMTSMCFIPGPEMDPEDAIYEDEFRWPAEPQNLVDCQQGLCYLEWRDRILFQGRLFYLTERNYWRDGWFCIVGSKLWQCQTPLSSGSLSSLSPQQEKRIRCLELEALQQIETNQGIIRIMSQSRDEEECQSQDVFTRKDDEDEDGSLYSVRNAFRLRLRVTAKSEAVPLTATIQEFHTESLEMMRAWISAIVSCCRDAPRRPYWIREDA
ncbi:hypothetical protein BGX28_005051 [Mortierella sp. GBA30]|nr:hypothetical protein BGX28_005051 [Mortierella sp. GBA30]